MFQIFLKRLLTALKRFDIALIVPITVLLLIGLLMHYSIDVNQTEVATNNWIKHGAAIVIGLIGFIVLGWFNHRLFIIHPLLLWGCATLILLSVLVFGTTIQGTRGWFVLAGVSFQPVELVKLLYILMIASYLQRSPQLLRKTKAVLVTGGLTFGLMACILLQPDLGSALILASLWFWYLWLLRARSQVIIIAATGFLVAGLLSWFLVLQDYQKDRLLTFVHPSADPLGAGYNLHQSIIAVGSGQWWGRGLGFGTQSQLHFLPEASSDFIFAAIAEEFGFIGALVIIGCICFIAYRLWKYAISTDDIFSAVLVVGVMCYLITQSALVIGMNIGLLPITGVPLPLLSSGGSSMIVTLWMLGLAHRVGMEANHQSR